MSGAKAETVLDATRERPREREEMRAAIVDAAKRLLERSGIEALTLRAVAKEAQIGRATIYGYFSSKRELFVQLGLVAPEAGGEAAAAESAPAAEQAPAPAAEDEAAAPQSEAPSPSPEAAGEEHQRLMQAQADALNQIVRRVIVPKSLMKEGTDTVLSRVETRLSVAEQSAAALERRLDEQLKELSGRTSAVAESLQQLQARVSTFEQRQLAAVAELRLDLHNLLAGESAAQTVPAAPAPEPVPEPEPAPEPEPEPEAVPQASAEPPPQSEPPAETVEKTPAAGNYLSSARQAAINAARIVVPEKARKVRWLPRWLFRNKRRVWRILGMAAVAVAAFDVIVLVVYPPLAATRIDASAAPVKAVRPAPARDVARDQLVLGMRLLNGTGAALNVEKAARVLEKAAAAGQPVAMNLTGVLYQTGTGVRADMAEAVKWYEASARHGNVKAMANLGKVYAGGWEEETDYVKAAQWFARAAAFGDVDAQFDLAILYERGQGVSRSIADAYKWYAIAGAEGDPNAKARAELLSARLMPDELQAAQASIAAFKPDRIDRAANDVPPLPQNPK